MKRNHLAVLLLPLLVAGCGANKKYVNEQVAAAEERQNSRMTALVSKTDDNAQQIGRLQALADELSKKTDKALNQVAGFEKYQILWQGEVTFGFDKASLNNDAEGILDDAGRHLMDSKNAIAEIAGFTDRVGSQDYNYQLGERRANTVRRYLVDKYSIPLFRMFIISHGKDKVTGMPDERHAGSKDRKVTVTLWGPQSNDQASMQTPDNVADTAQAR